MINQTEEEFWEEFQQLEKITEGYEYRPNINKWRDSNYYYYIIKYCINCNKLKIIRTTYRGFCSLRCSSQYNYLGIKEKINAGCSKSNKERWKDPKYREKMIKLISKSNKKRFKNDPLLAIKMNRKLWNNPKHRKMILESRKSHHKIMHEKWKDPEYKKMISDSIKKSTSSQSHKIIHKILKNNFPILYSEYIKTICKQNRTKQEIKLMNELWDRLYRKNDEMKLQIAMEIEYQKELSNKPLTENNFNNI